MTPIPCPSTGVTASSVKRPSMLESLTTTWVDVGSPLSQAPITISSPAKPMVSRALASQLPFLAHSPSKDCRPLKPNVPLIPAGLSSPSPPSLSSFSGSSPPHPPPSFSAPSSSCASTLASFLTHPTPPISTNSSAPWPLVSSLPRSSPGSSTATASPPPSPT